MRFPSPSQPTAAGRWSLLTLWFRLCRLGVTGAVDVRLAKRIILCNQICVTFCLLTVPFSLVHAWLGALSLSGILLAACIGYVLTLGMNRYGHTHLSRIFLVALGNISLLACALTLGKSSGMHLYFLINSWMGIILFNPDERKSLFYCFLLGISLMAGFEVFTLAHTDAHPFPPRVERIFYYTNLLLFQLIQITIVFYFFLGNHRTEEALAKAGEAAQAADKAKSRFLANMSHEIRTPLNGILGMAGLLIGRIADGERVEAARIIRSSALDLLAIVNGILDISKIEAGRMTLEKVPFRLRSSVASLLRPFEMEAAARGLKFSLDLPESVPEHLVGDPVRLKQVLNNLLHNAFKFTAEGEISLKIALQDAPAAAGPAGSALPGIILLFEVEDTGIGIPEAARDRLFQIFVQADGSTTRKYGGTGLGLHISRQIVEMMGGTIGFRAGKGGGTIFRFTAEFTVDQSFAAEAAVVESRPAAEAPPMAGPRAREESPGTLRILVVEDHPVNRKVAEAMLAGLDYQAEMAVDGEDALRACSAREFDLVFMDCHMPGLDGFACTRRLREMPARGRRMAIIGVTADAMAETRARCLRAGMDDVITKPILIEELRRVLRVLSSTPEPVQPVPEKREAEDSGWLNRRQMREMAEYFQASNPDLWEQTLKRFHLDALRLLQKIRGECAGEMFREARESAHSLKGVCLMLGFRRMAEICAKLEHLLAGANPAGWPARFAELEGALEPSLGELRELRKIGEPI